MDPAHMPAHPVPETDLLISDPAPWSLRGTVLASAIWNVVSAVLWGIGVITIPLAITCAILAFFEFKYVVEAGKLSRLRAAERARKLSSWEIGALVYCGGPLTFCFGVAVKILAKRELARG